MSSAGLVLTAWLGAMGASVWLTGVVYRYAVKHAMLDMPNARSSHAAPTPRGGGVAIAFAGTVAFVLASAFGLLPATDAAGLVGGGALVALVGWLDDRRPRPAAVRAVAQLIAAVWLLGCGGELPSLDGGVAAVARVVFLLLVIVWSANLFNFMDGIDGIAGGLGAIAATAGALLLLASGLPGLAIGSAAIAGSCAGFLRWNWSPARIFMGDVGSSVLGFWFGALAVLSAQQGGPAVGVWMLLGGCFVVDATITLIRRILRGERWYEGHRTHAYQRAVLSGFRHAQVSGATMLLSVALAGTAGAVWRAWISLGTGLLAAAVVLGGIYLWVERRFPMPPRSSIS